MFKDKETKRKYEVDWLQNNPEVREERARTAAAWNASHPERRKEIEQKHKLKRYGITPDKYAEKLEKQQGLCALCNNPPSGKGRSGQSLHVDHDHVTGELRDLLCGSCNRALGLFHDDPELLAKAVRYILNHRTNNLSILPEKQWEIVSTTEST